MIVLFRKEMLAEQKYHSKVLDGVCVSDRKETKREKVEEAGGRLRSWKGCMGSRPPNQEGRNLTDHTARQRLS